jgi:energy-coupling factor transport system ATP-binding protein
VNVIDGGEISLADTQDTVFSAVGKHISVGLDVPQATELIHALRREGYDLPEDIITEAACVEAICGLLEEKGVAR